MRQQNRVNRIILFMIAVIVIVSVGIGTMVNLSSVSYYQGIHPSFVAVYHENQFYTTQTPLDSGTARIGLSTMNFDPDANDARLPNLQGELRDIQVISDLSRFDIPETYVHILNDFDGDPTAGKPYKVYEWRVDQGDGTDKLYEMDLYLASLEVNTFFKADWNRNVFVSERNNQRYHDTEVWLRLETTNEWGNVFNDPNIKDTYFGIGYMELADFQIYQEDPALDVTPRTQWVALDLYDSVQGLPEVSTSPIQVANKIVGSELNDKYFKDEYFTKYTIGNGGSYGYNVIDGSYDVDSFQQTILVHVFVVGEWVVQNGMDRDVPVTDPADRTGWLESMKESFAELIASFGTPLGKVKLAILVFVAIVVFIMLTNPAILLNWYDVATEIGKRRSAQ